MVGHVLLKKNPFAVRNWSGQMSDDFPPIRFSTRDHFVPTGMLDKRGLQIVRVKRLIDNDSIVPITPGAHHRGGDVPRPGPHGDAGGHGVNSRAAGPRMQRVEDNAFHRDQADRLLRRRWLRHRGRSSELALGKNANQRTM